MKLEAKLNIKYYICALLLLGSCAFGWYGVYFLNTNTILMEDNTPMTTDTKLIFSVVLGLVITSWTLSFIAMIRQIFLGYAFRIDESGIHNSLTAVNILAFIFVIPFKKIPYSAITKYDEQNGIFTIHFDKSKIDISPILRILLRNEYHFFNSLTPVKKEEVKKQLEQYITL